jgi:hypothetical protein
MHVGGDYKARRGWLSISVSPWDMSGCCSMSQSQRLVLFLRICKIYVLNLKSSATMHAYMITRQMFNSILSSVAVFAFVHDHYTFLRWNSVKNALALQVLVWLPNGNPMYDKQCEQKELLLSLWLHLTICWYLAWC